MACASQCQVVEDVKLGWAGFCIGLSKLNTSSDAEFCRRSCCEDPHCEVWQWGGKQDLVRPDGLGTCYVGKGLECTREHWGDFLVLAGQRISHGDVVADKTVSLPKGQWCVGDGMRQQVSNNRTNGSLGTNRPSLAGDYSDPTKDCKHACYGDATCSVWQFSSFMGCWLGTASEASCKMQAPQDMLGGERVVRACGSEAIRQMQTDFVKVFGIIGLVAVLLTCCALIILLSQARTVQKKHTRSAERGEGDGSESDAESESLGMISHRELSHEIPGNSTPGQTLTPVPGMTLNAQAPQPPGGRSQGPPSSAGSFQSWTPYQSNPGPSPPSFASNTSSFVQPGHPSAPGNRPNMQAR